MKGQSTQPASANPMARGPGNGMGATPVGKDQSTQPAAPAAPDNPGPYGTTATYDPGTSSATNSLYDFSGLGGMNAGLAASRVAEGPSFGTQSFGQQGFSGTSAAPQSAPIAGVTMKTSAPMAPNYLPQPLPANMGYRQMAPGSPAPRDPTAPLNTDPAQYGPTTNSIDTSNVPSLVGGDALTNMTQQSRDAAYKAATGYLDPQWANQQTALENKLANQGVMQNSEAWNKAMDDFARQKEFAYGQARENAIGQGNAAQAQLFGEGLAANSNQFGQNTTQAQLRNAAQQQLAQQGFTQQQITNLEAQNRFNNSLSARNQGINELLLQQQNPLQMYNALTNGTQVAQPNFTNANGANIGNTDILQAIQQAYGGRLNAYNAQVGSTNSSNAGMAAIIAALLGG